LVTRINACDGCEIITCLVDPGVDTARTHGGTGGFICQKCLMFKSWNQSVDPEFHPDAAKSLAQISRVLIAECPYGRQMKVRMSMCFPCFEGRKEYKE
jgi:hypothetical protein